MKLQSQAPFAPIDLIWSFSMTFLQKVKYFSLLSTIFHFHNISQNSPDLDYSNKNIKFLVVKRLATPRCLLGLQEKNIWINNIFRIFAHLIYISIFDIFSVQSPASTQTTFDLFQIIRTKGTIENINVIFLWNIFPFPLWVFVMFFKCFFRFIHSCIEMRMCFTAKWNH